MEEETLTMREVSRELGIPVYTIRYFCNHGLVPNVRRARGGRRVFTAEQCDWLKSLWQLKNCGLKVDELRKYARLCRDGDVTLAERKAILTTQERQLRQEAEDISQAIDFLERREELIDKIINQPTTEHSPWM